MDDANLFLSTFEARCNAAAKKNAAAQDRAVKRLFAAPENKRAAADKALQRLGTACGQISHVRSVLYDLRRCFTPGALFLPGPGECMFVHTYEAEGKLLLDVKPLVIPQVITIHQRRHTAPKNAAEVRQAAEETADELLALYPNAGIVRGTSADALWQPCPKCRTRSPLIFDHRPPHEDYDTGYRAEETFGIALACIDCMRIYGVAWGDGGGLLAKGFRPAIARR